MARAAPAATRASSILALLTAHRRGFTISEVAQHLGMNLASAHATLAVLCDFGFLVRDPRHRTYVVGPALAATGFAALDHHPAIGAAIEQAEVLAEELDAEAGVFAVAGRDVILLARRGPEPLGTSIGYAGDRTPLLAPIGAVFMAWADDDAVEVWIERAQLPVPTADRYRAVLAEVRMRGFSVPMQPIASPAVLEAMDRVRSNPDDDKAEHRLTDVLQKTDEMLVLLDARSESDEIAYETVTAPIFDPIGRVLLSLGITGPGHPVPVSAVLQLGRRLTQSATIATRRARGRIPNTDASVSLA